MCSRGLKQMEASSHSLIVHDHVRGSIFLGSLGNMIFELSGEGGRSTSKKGLAQHVPWFPPGKTSILLVKGKDSRPSSRNGDVVLSRNLFADHGP